MTRRILLIGHPRRPEAQHIARTLVRELAANDIQVTGCEDELAAFGVVDEPNVYDGDADPAGCELAVVLGGDGTILRGAELVREAGVPLLGINLGHVGFLAEAEPEDVHRTARGIVERTWTVEERETLEVEVSHQGESLWTSWALNEASVEKAARERMIELTVEIDGRPLSTWGCDGVVMATPTGSTAYAFSAGGPVMWPGVEAILMVPLSAHALFSRPLVFSHDVRIAVELLSQSAGGAVLWCDGRRSTDLPPGARIEVRRSPLPVRLARLSPAPFTDRLVAKFDLSVSGWRGTGDR
ncbi:NAD kinase [Calidifontibacter sp. DB0510]|uniref:NAD kinase n=1 Tax=Metallococcus carri TaxID=1656884 RepID=A0A967EDU3_9MICO|nr:NAD kinase [Metallococcus carri]NHN55051.1 NAD kinase [Metallococcus carri]NOP37397.1 NAD kinase [Calidifontibacter sp. DB2511S]